MGCYLFHFIWNENLGSLEEQLSNFVLSGEATSVHLLLFICCRQKSGCSSSVFFPVVVRTKSVHELVTEKQPTNEKAKFKQPT